MRTSAECATLVRRLFLMLLFAWPLLAHAAAEFHLASSPEPYLPDAVPPNAERLYHRGPVSGQGPPVAYLYRWNFKDKRGISRGVQLSYTLFELPSARYFHGSDIKSNAQAAYLTVVQGARSRVCWSTSSGAQQNFTIRATDIERRHLENCGADLTKELRRAPVPDSSHVYVTRYDSSIKTQFEQQFYGHYGNVVVEVHVIEGDDSFDASVIGLAALSRLTGKLTATETPAQSAAEPAAAPAADAGPRFEVFALPSAVGDQESRRAFLPASNKLPARLVAKAKAGTPVTFAIREGDNAVLQAGSSTGQQVVVKANSNHVAEALFYYNGGKINGPLTYQVRVSMAGERDTLTVHVGLGLAFERIKAVKGDMRDTYPFTLTVKSRFHPTLRIGDYLTSAKSSGIWNDLTVGIRLSAHWVNMPPGAVADEAFRGTVHIANTPEGNNLLVVANNEAPGKPQYYLTNYPYPAVVMKSDGRHTYRIDGELALLTPDGISVASLEESLQQSGTLAIVARDTPEHWLTSLVCSLEVTTTEQYVMLETAKMLPVGGTAVELLTSATGLMCKFGQAEYESLFYDIGTILGGKYLDHLLEPEVFEKLTPKQQTAAQLAKKAYDELDEYKQNQERDKWLKNPVRPPAPSAARPEQADDPAPPASPSLNEAAKEAGKALEEGVGKSMKELRDTFKGIFRGR
ncbi:MAG TPA: hypothetical protein VGE12_23000 [Noviherbaspirillum sp.]